MNSKVYNSRSQMRRRLTLTKQVLRCISHHLSGNESCRGVSYVVVIAKTCITLDVPVQLCMHVNGRRTSIKVPAIHHVILNHFPELFGEVVNGSKIKISNNVLELGTYEYRVSVTGKSRRWFKAR